MAQVGGYVYPPNLSPLPCCFSLSGGLTALYKAEGLALGPSGLGSWGSLLPAELSTGTYLLHFSMMRAGLEGRAHAVHWEPVLGLLTDCCPAFSVLLRFLVNEDSWAGIKFGAPQV